MLAIIGYLVICVMMYLILKGKVIPAICFAVLPVLGAFIAGFNLTEVLAFIDKGLGTTWKTAVLFIFSVIYFGIMNDAGLFDRMVAALIKHAGNRLPFIMVSTVVIATIGHLDGAAASTYLITIPVMLSIFKRMRLRPTIMLLLVSVATGVMNIVPWGGPLMRAANAIKGDAQAMWHQLIPLQVVGMACGVFLALYFARVEKRRLAAAGVDLQAISASAESDVEVEEHKASTFKRPKMVIVNLILTVLLIAGLIQGRVPAFILFMFGMVIAAAVNYPSLKQQNERIAAHAPNCIGLVVTLLCAGVFLGIFANSGIIAAMTKVLIDLLPDFMLR